MLQLGLCGSVCVTIYVMFARLCTAMLCYGTVWHGMTRYDVLWYGMAWHGMLLYIFIMYVSDGHRQR